MIQMWQRKSQISLLRRIESEMANSQTLECNCVKLETNKNPYSQYIGHEF